MIKILFVLMIVFLLYNCTSYPPELSESLMLAGENRKELLHMLEHYKQDKDTLKYKAACFLIKNMQWHYAEQTVEKIDPRLDLFWQGCDSLYSRAVDRISDTRLDEKNTLLWDYSDAIQVVSAFMPIDTNVQVVKHPVKDVEVIKADFLIPHIDNAFRVWKESPFARHLSFEEFCEYILPYRSVNGVVCSENGQFLRERFGKHLFRSTGKTLRSYLTRYNRYINHVWLCSRHIRLPESTGIFDVFFTNFIDCVTLSNNECNVLRACGFPVVIDNMIAYREYRSRHFYCVFLDSLNQRHLFNAQSTYVDTVSPIARPSVNFYRNTFAAQKDSPVFLKAKKEKIPLELANPCIKDVTSEVYETVSITLPFEEETENNLGYLCTFCGSASGGVIPVTWGVINKENKEITFQNALFNVLYFPMYMQGGKLHEWGRPFYLEKDSLRGDWQLRYLDGNEEQAKGTLLLNRKFPLKKDLLDLAPSFIGGRIEGANKKDFSDARLLYVFKEVPKPYWAEYVFENTEAYQYYRFMAPPGGSHIAEMQFLTHRVPEMQYTAEATPLPVFSEEQITNSRDPFVKVIELDTFSMKSSAFADGNALSYSLYSEASLHLEEPVVVDRIRLLPRTADNMVKPGDEYVLFYWNNGWCEVGKQKAKYNFLKFENVPMGKIYWLVDITQGQEDLPFIYKDGKQLFIYDSVITDREI
ncbi:MULTISPECIES: hypothetical protein [Butyricimonas]|uniref:hypothetical protein n=1 Tax=Butyricimonas TaxID=574697 RepID=UPI0007FB2C80|nr:MULTISPECIES: hypothetical protein [Butyricimonas]